MRGNQRPATAHGTPLLTQGACLVSGSSKLPPTVLRLQVASWPLFARSRPNWTNMLLLLTLGADRKPNPPNDNGRFATSHDSGWMSAPKIRVRHSFKEAVWFTAYSSVCAEEICPGASTIEKQQPSSLQILDRRDPLQQLPMTRWSWCCTFSWVPERNSQNLHTLLRRRKTAVHRRTVARTSGRRTTVLGRYPHREVSSVAIVVAKRQPLGQPHVARLSSKPV